MSRYDRTVQGGLLAALLFYGVSLTAPAYAAPVDALMPIEQYTTAKARGLANAHRLRLIEFSGPDGFYTRVVVDAGRIPQRLEYRAAKDEIWTTTFSERRAVSGLLLPYHVVTTGRGGVREDLRLDEILVNPQLSKEDFAGPKQ